jgi:hypothetical protein
MEKLEKIVVGFARKHPVITSVALIKLAESALIASAYMIWPDETSNAMNCLYQTGKHCCNAFYPVSPVIASYQKEIADSIRHLPSVLRAIYI